MKRVKVILNEEKNTSRKTRTCPCCLEDMKFSPVRKVARALSQFEKAFAEENLKCPWNRYVQSATIEQTAKNIIKGPSSACLKAFDFLMDLKYSQSFTVHNPIEQLLLEWGRRVITEYAKRGMVPGMLNFSASPTNMDKFLNWLRNDSEDFWFRKIYDHRKVRREVKKIFKNIAENPRVWDYQRGRWKYL